MPPNPRLERPAVAYVAIGVATLLIVLGVMTGMEHDLRDKILGFNLSAWSN